MNFFEHQDRARRKTKQLVLLLALAVIALIVITTLAVAALVYLSGHAEAEAYDQRYGFWLGVIHALSLETFFWIALAVGSVVFLGSLFRFAQLGAGGRAIAEALGGRLLLGHTTDPDERKILNIVEEMAIASGTPVPPVYLMEDNAINAFAAGYHPQDAVIGITRGCIAQLSRDELQGVIAHEFSHIFHGDMRLNMRLVALLYGILIIGLIGEFIVRSRRVSSLATSSRDKSPGGILLVGVGLLVIGYTGTFFGNLIKAAVSRQREFLADASAVQFTRNPDGIAGALKKIGASSAGSTLHNHHAAEFSHMYFSQGVKLFFNMMATHPPLSERIKRIQPYWNGKFEFSPSRATSAGTNAGINTEINTNKGSKTFNDQLSGFAQPASGPATDLNSSLDQDSPFDLDNTFDLDRTLQQIAQPTQAQLNYAQRCLTEITPELKAASQDAFSARAIVFGLLLDTEQEQRNRQLSLLTRNLSTAELQSLNPIIYASSQSAVHLRLPLIELCITALKQLSDVQHARFLHCLNLLIHADHKVSLMEWAIYRIVLHNTRPTPRPLRSRSLQEMHEDCQLLLSLVAHTGAAHQADAESAFALAAQALPFSQFTLLAREAITLEAIDAALECLNHIKPLQKPQLLKAISICVMHDGKLHSQEAELFRALADGLDCPIPPQIQAVAITPLASAAAH
jgi:Zn-dependent protease with chaperone function